MATTITIACPDCHKEIKAPADVLGKKIRCKGCGNTFAAQAPADKAPTGKKAPAGKAPGKAAPAKGGGKPAAGAKAAKPQAATPKKPADDEIDSNPYGVTDLDLTPRCPDCANEMESETAVICLHCGYNTMTREKATTRKVRDVTGGDVFLWLLPGILCVLAIILLITLDILYCVKIGDWVDTDVWYGAFLAAGAIKMWMVIMSLFVMFFAGKFAIKRLIFNNKPPEVEETK